LAIGNGSSIDQLNSNGYYISDNTWHHVAVSRSGSLVSFYVDGNPAGTASSTITPGPITNTSIGAGLYNGTVQSYFVGEIDEVRIWTTARTLAEIQSFQNCDIPAPLPNLSALYRFNLGMGYYIKADYLNAIIAWDEALLLYTELRDKRGIANMLSNKGAVYYNQGDEAKSLELDLQSLKLSEEINDTLRIVTSLTNIGTVYLNKEATW
jgi:tetratricopeptide (TPR) repeat protein